jgi:hypothetical protein
VLRTFSGCPPAIDEGGKGGDVIDCGVGTAFPRGGADMVSSDNLSLGLSLTSFLEALSDSSGVLEGSGVGGDITGSEGMAISSFGSVLTFLGVPEQPMVSMMKNRMSNATQNQLLFIPQGLLSSFYYPSFPGRGTGRMIL